MMLLPLLCLLTAGYGPTSALEIRPGVVTVSEGEDAVLPCTMRPEHNMNKFHWKKDGEKEKLEVFFYEDGKYYGHDLQDPDKQFIGRVDFFKEELKDGNAAIKIKNTQVDDNGTYTCVLFDSQNNPSNINIRLNVGAARMPYISIRNKNTWKLLECEAQGVPEPEVEWRNSAGEVLKTMEKYTPKNHNGPFHVKLTLNVTRSDNYTCVVTQRGIYHQINNTQEVSFPESVAVSEGYDAILPCSLYSKENIQSMVFSWSKDNKEIFFYNRGSTEVDEQLEKRLIYFQHEFKFGNASIKILNSQKSDRGHYSCHFADKQQSHIVLHITEASHFWRNITILIVCLLFAAFVVIGGLMAMLIKEKKKKKEETQPPY